MKRFAFILITVVVTANVALAQEKLIKKSWIKYWIQDFSKAAKDQDTTYLRYTFDQSNVAVGFEPAWNFTTIPYTFKLNTMTLGVDRWNIEKLTDSTLTIFLPGFRRIFFVAEDYLQAKAVQKTVPIGEFNGKLLYKANQIITPRYKKNYPLENDIQKEDRSDDYGIRTAGIFSMSFIVTDEGKIADPKILISVAPRFDANVIKELRKTSKQWHPAKLNGQPIQTLVIFTVNYLDSLD